MVAFRKYRLNSGAYFHANELSVTARTLFKINLFVCKMIFFSTPFSTQLQLKPAWLQRKSFHIDLIQYIICTEYYQKFAWPSILFRNLPLPHVGLFWTPQNACLAKPGQLVHWNCPFFLALRFLPDSGRNGQLDIWIITTGTVDSRACEMQNHRIAFGFKSCAREDCLWHP